jgi:hypothetical protein
MVRLYCVLVYRLVLYDIYSVWSCIVLFVFRGTPGESHIVLQHSILTPMSGDPRAHEGGAPLRQADAGADGARVLRRHPEGPCQCSLSVCVARVVYKVGVVSLLRNQGTSRM